MDTKDPNSIIFKQVDDVLQATADTRNDEGLFRVDSVFHSHNGVDGPQVDFQTLANIPITVKGDILVYGRQPTKLAVGTNAQVLEADSTTTTGLKWVTLPTIYGPNIFGDGSDGSVTFDGSTTILGMVPSGNVYTMTRDIFCTNITINNSVFLKPAGHMIFATGTLTVGGTLSAVGANGVNGTAGTTQAADGFGVGGAGGAGGAGVSDGTIRGSIAGKSGGLGGTGGTSAGTAGTAGVAETFGVSASSGGAGGAGGAGENLGGSQLAGGASGAGGATTYVSKIASLAKASAPYVAGNFIGAIGGAGSAGGGGGGNGATTPASFAGAGGGGGSGANGGQILVFAKIVANSFAISANGGNGGVGGAGGNATGGSGGRNAAGGGGGGGSGGSGGWVTIVTTSYTGSNPTVTGGAAGGGGSAGTGTGFSSAGNGGAAGTVGLATVITFA